MTKKIIVLFAIVTFTYLLVILGSGMKGDQKEIEVEKATIKDVLTSAYEDIKSPQSFETETTFDFDYVAKEERIKEDNVTQGLMSNLILTMNTKNDLEKKKSEVRFKGELKHGFYNIDFNVPMQLDGENNQFYLEIQPVLEIANGFMPGVFPKEMEAVYLQTDLDSAAGMAGKNPYFKEDALKNRELIKEITYILKTFIDEKEASDFTEEDGKIKTDYNKDDLRKILIMVEKMNADEFDQAKASERVALFLENITISDFYTLTTIEKGQIVNENSILDFSVNGDESNHIALTIDSTFQEGYVTENEINVTIESNDDIISLNMDTEITNHDGEILFDLNPTSENSIDEKTFQRLIE